MKIPMRVAQPVLKVATTGDIAGYDITSTMRALVATATTNPAAGLSTKELVEQAIANLAAEAAEVGADAVVELQITVVSTYEVLAVGTAVRLDVVYR